MTEELSKSELIGVAKQLWNELKTQERIIIRGQNDINAVLAIIEEWLTLAEAPTNKR